MGIRLNHPNSREARAPNEHYLKGVSRLVNPPSEDAEIVSGEEDPGERDYLGRLLHVADEALSRFKRRLFQSTRRGRIH
jgi:hypothetical protein